jgi:uncharacterized protein YqjF (DUF2071 family)
MGQSWLDLLFAHWRMPVEALRRHVPEAIPIDTFDGSAWLGVTPFEVVGLHARGVPPLPWLSQFPELNVRTYTTIDGRPGIWFFRLYADRAAAVVAARLSYQLPYRHAAMSIARAGTRIAYRVDGRFAATYEPAGPVALPQPGTLEHFLTERYCLYTMAGGRLWRADIHHRPWPLQAARADVAENTLAPDEPPLLHYAARQDVLVWPLMRIAAGSPSPRS